MKQFQGEDENSPLNIDLKKYISNKLDTYLNSDNFHDDLTKYMCELTGKGRFIDSGSFKGKCTFKK